MRSISAVGVICMTALSCSAVADEAVRPGLAPGNLFDEVERGDYRSWQSQSGNRLSYLHDSQCTTPGGCPATRGFNVAERDYIKALHLGTYGPMDLKFTGKRVKLKVRF